MKCEKCGRELKSDAKFCDGCGAVVTNTNETETSSGLVSEQQSSEVSASKQEAVDDMYISESDTSDRPAKKSKAVVIALVSILAVLAAGGGACFLFRDAIFGGEGGEEMSQIQSGTDESREEKETEEETTETQSEAPTTEEPVTEADPAAELLNAVIEQENLWMGVVSSEYEKLWFQDFNFDGVNELIVGGRASDENTYTVFQVYHFTGSGWEYVTGFSGMMDTDASDVLKLCYDNENDNYMYVNINSYIRAGLSDTYLYAYNDFQSNMILGASIDTQSNPPKSWYNSDYEPIAEADYVAIYNNFIEDLSYVETNYDVISESDYTALTDEEKYSVLSDAYYSFVIGDVVGGFTQLTVQEVITEPVTEAPTETFSEAPAENPDAEAEDFAWTLENGTLTLSGHGRMPYWDAYVTPWYEDRETITKIVIAEGLTSIADYAFSSYEALTTAVIADTVTEIGNGVFSGCDNLVNVTIPNGVTEIGGAAFDTTGITDIVIPDTVTFLGGNAFRHCYSLTSVTIPGSIAVIGKAAFIGCENLTAVTIQNGVTAIEHSAFEDCDSLEQVTIPSTVTAIGTYAFEGCDMLSSVVISGSVTCLGQGAFENCIKLSSITIPRSMETIEKDAFYCCKQLTDVYYNGTRSEWTAMVIYSNNTPLTSAAIHFTEE